MEATTNERSLGPRRRATARVGVAVACAALLLLAVSACGKPADTTSTTPGAPGAGTPPGTDGGLGIGIGAATSGTGVTGTTVSISATVFYEGYKITMADATFEKARQEVVLPLDVENQGSSEATFYGSSITLDDATTTVAYGNIPSPPTIAAKGQATTTVVFSVSEDFTGDGLVLVMGSSEQQQVRIPLSGSGRGSGTTTTLDPVGQDTPPELAVGEVTIAPSGFELRYDDVENHTQAPKGTVYLDLRASASNSSKEDTYYVGTDQATLALPDGTSRAADAYDCTCAGLDPGDANDVRLLWSVPESFTGAATITFAAPWGAGSSEVTAPMPITVKGAD